MKKVIALVLAMVLCFGLAACGGSSSNNTPANNSGSTEKWPGKDPVNVFVPGKAGGPTDTAARIVVEYLKKATGGNFVVMNDDTGGGVGVCESVRTAKDTSHNIAILGSQNINAVQAGTYKYDIRNNEYFTIIDRVITGAHDNFLVISKSAPFSDYDGFVKYAKENPNKVRFCQQTGSLSALYAKMVTEKEGIDVHFLEASTNEAETNLLGGLADVAILSFTKVNGYKEDGRILPLLCIGAERDSDYPNIKCFGDIGLGDRIAKGGQFMVSGKGFDPAIAAYINEVLQGITKDEESVTRAKNSANVLVPVGQAEAIKIYDQVYKMYESVK